MQFPESWLRTFCNPALDTAQLCDTLTMAGLEVEELRPVAPPFSGVVVGEILSAQAHPNADRLRVCQVDAGGPAPLTIVCGAPNARAGIKVPLACVGAELPPAEAGGAPFRIKVGKLRGVESHGMLCSARELGLSSDHGGLLELDAALPVGQSIRLALNLDDHLITLKLTPNLAHCLSVYGVARELSALTGAPLHTPPIAPLAPTCADVLPVDVQARDLCGRFSGRVIRGVNPQAATPAWMVERLARCGQRSVSALVDISNYVMFELGRPTHIFDLDKIHGGLHVRWAKPQERLELLNGETVELDARVGVIADDRAVESLAGIMGGQATAVSDSTRAIYVEAAFWWPQAVAGRSRRYNFATDAGHRFERGVDPALTVAHIEHISALIVQICGTAATQCGPIDDQCPALPPTPSVTLRVARAERVLGMPLGQARCAQALRGLGLAVTEGDGVVSVQVPSWRFDLQIEEDLIEEVARVVGYAQLPHTPPVAPVVAQLQPEALRTEWAVRHALADLGYQETINYSFVEARWEADLAGQSDPLRLLNPIASQMSVMRSSLLGSLLQVLKYNQDRRADRVRVFEVGRVFQRDPSVCDGLGDVAGVHQPLRVALLASGARLALDWSGQSSPVDFYDIKGDIEQLAAPLALRFEPAQHPAFHPGRCAQVWCDDQPLGHVGELHPRWRQQWDLNTAPLLAELDLNALLRRPVPQARALPRQQAVQRDLAVWVDESVSHAALMQAVHSADCGGVLQSAHVFDIFRPQASLAQTMARKSVAIRLQLGHATDALTEAQIDAAVAAVSAALEQRLAAQQRA